MRRTLLRLAFVLGSAVVVAVSLRLTEELPLIGSGAELQSELVERLEQAIELRLEEAGGDAAGGDLGRLAAAFAEQRQAADAGVQPAGGAPARSAPGGRKVLDPEPAVPRLKAIIGRAGRRTALVVLGGKTVVAEVGARVGEAVVQRIDRDAVILEGPDGAQVLRLDPERLGVHASD